MKREPTLKECYAVSETINRVVECAAQAIAYLKVWRQLRAVGKSNKHCRYKLRDARRELKEALAKLRSEIGKGRSFPMWCVLDRSNLRTGWVYFNIYPSERQAKKTAKTIRTKGNREAVVVPVRIPLPEEE